MKQGVLPRIIFADLPVLRYIPCAAVSRSIAKSSKSWRIKVVAFRIAVTLISVRHGTLKLTKKTLLVGAQTLKIENSVALHVLT